MEVFELSDEILKEIQKAVKDHDTEAGIYWTKKAIEEKIDPIKSLEILTDTMKEIGDGYSRGEFFLPDLVGGADVVKNAMPFIFEEFERNRVIFYCEKYAQPKAVKKLFIFNHALIDIVSYKKNFNNLFKNMVYLELQRRNDEIYYLDNVDFYLPEFNQIVLAIPFFNSLVSSTIISRILPYMEEHKISSVTIVTVSSEQSIFIDDVEALALPFYNWVLTL